LVYLSHVREEKGIFVLLESLRRLHEQGESIECDICGPIYDDVADRFQQELSKIPNAKYVGVLKPAEVISTMGQYDALVFPSYYVGEGHPGVLIEAMMAGIPAITTRFRSIPEIVEDGVNGLLVEPQSPDDLARVIRLMANDRGLLNELTENSFRKRNDFTAAELAPRILISMGVPLSREDQ
jgi:glycosyltransferase involved in cell wall biosynthesis